MNKRESYAEITLKSGAVVTFPCTSLAWKQRRNALGEVTNATLEWKQPEGSPRRPVHIDLDEIAAVLFVDGAL